jgi:chromate transport protein ChrA
MMSIEEFQNVVYDADLLPGVVAMHMPTTVGFSHLKWLINGNFTVARADACGNG